jgi:hypothetical protein
MTIQTLTVSSETAKIHLMKLVKEELPQRDVYIRDGGSVSPWLLLTQYPVDCDVLNVDYRMPVTEIVASWSTIKMAICAYRSSFCITHNGTPVAILKASKFLHPMWDYRCSET